MDNKTLLSQTNISFTKQIKDILRSSLAGIWNSNELSLNHSSQAELSNRRANNFFTLISKDLLLIPKKKLCLPHITESPKKSKFNKFPDFDILYSNVTFSYNKPFQFDDKSINILTFVFKGNENKDLAWSDFKKKLPLVKEAVVATFNVIFQFTSKGIRVKCKTQSASDKVERYTNQVPYIKEDKAIELINELINNEPISIYSTDPFRYSVIAPMFNKKSELKTKDGIVYRQTFTGSIFPSTSLKLFNKYPDSKNVRKTAISLF